MCSVVSDSLQPHGLWPAKLLCPWNFPGKNTGVCCHFLLQGIFPTQGSKPPLLHCGQISYHCVTWEVHHFLNDNLKTIIRKRIWSENKEQYFRWKNSRLNRNFKMSHSFLILLHPNMSFVLNQCLRAACWVVCVRAKLLQSCLTLCDVVDCSPPGFSVHGILQARILEWAAELSSRGSSQPRDWARV